MTVIAAEGAEAAGAAAGSTAEGSAAAESASSQSGGRAAAGSGKGKGSSAAKDLATAAAGSGGQKSGGEGGEHAPKKKSKKSTGIGPPKFTHPRQILMAEFLICCTVGIVLKPLGSSNAKGSATGLLLQMAGIFGTFFVLAILAAGGKSTLAKASAAFGLIVTAGVIFNNRTVFSNIGSAISNISFSGGTGSTGGTGGSTGGSTGSSGTGQAA